MAYKHFCVLASELPLQERIQFTPGRQQRIQLTPDRQQRIQFTLDSQQRIQLTPDTTKTVTLSSTNTLVRKCMNDTRITLLSPGQAHVLAQLIYCRRISVHELHSSSESHEWVKATAIAGAELTSFCWSSQVDTDMAILTHTYFQILLMSFSLKYTQTMLATF